MLTYVVMYGKTLRSTLGHRQEGQPSVHMLGFYECHSGIVLTQHAVASKENEISAAAPFLLELRVPLHRSFFASLTDISPRSRAPASPSIESSNIEDDKGSENTIKIRL